MKYKTWSNESGIMWLEDEIQFGAWILIDYDGNIHNTFALIISLFKIQLILGFSKRKIK
jgi:hypothetical protein